MQTHSQSEPHRVLLRNTETNLFYAGPAKWTEDSQKAHNFGTIKDAVLARGTLDLMRTEVVLHYYEMDCHVPLSVQEWW